MKKELHEFGEGEKYYYVADKKAENYFAIVTVPEGDVLLKEKKIVIRDNIKRFYIGTESNSPKLFMEFNEKGKKIIKTIGEINNLDIAVKWVAKVNKLYRKR